MTLFDLVIRSMRKNIKHYYLYFFALIFSVVLYFVFATLQHDTAIVAKTGESMNFESAFKVAGILLIIIAGIFVVYANAIFLKRRSREIGLYQLIGLTKGAVARLLIIENTLLSAGALIVGMGSGMLVSRVFLLLLMKLVGHDGFIALSFSVGAVIQTAVVFFVIILLTSAQMLYTVYRSTLLGLFNADKKGEQPKKPKTFVSATLALLGIGLIAFGYWLSTDMINEMLLLNMLAVLASTIFGTYLVFRVTIGWLFYQVRARKQGHLGLNNSLSLASLMHRMKGNANSLTIITVLSAMTLAMLAGSYSLYYSTEKQTRTMMPFDFTFSNEEDLAKEFLQELEEDEIVFSHSTVEAIQTGGRLDVSIPYWSDVSVSRPDITLYPAEQLRKARRDVQIPEKGSAVIYDVNLYFELNHDELPATLTIMENKLELPIKVATVENDSVMNIDMGGRAVVIANETFAELKGQIVQGDDGAWPVLIDTFLVPDHDQRAKASAIFMKDKYGHKSSEGDLYHGLDYHTMYEGAIQTNGLLIFIAGFLGLVFLISTGSILYFKQMTEAEQEKQSYATLRQLGFTVKDIMRGIIRKQVFVFGLPLAIGLLHSVFAINAASFIFMSDITIPTSIAMGLYVLIYLVFAFLTVGYYRKTVKEAL